MSALIISQHVGDRKISPSRWNKLQSIWVDIEKKELRNHRYEQKIANFFLQFQAELGSREAEKCVHTETFVYHLISFINKKTIYGPEAEALYRWIEEEIEDLKNNPFRQNDIKPLILKFKEALGSLVPSAKNQQPAVIDQEILDEVRPHFEQMIEEMLDETHSPSDEELKSFLDNPDEFIAFIKQKVEAQCEEEADLDDDFDDGETKTTRVDDFFDTKIISKLYRQLAKQFHPDKETDVTKKEHKKKLMQELSEAKKGKDTFAMLAMAQEWLPDFELNLDKSSLDSLEKTLQEKLTTLNQAHREMQNRNDIEGYIWQQFGGGSKAQQKKTLMKYQKDLIKDQEYLQSLPQSLKTVKSMRVALRDRVNNQSFFDIMEMVDTSFFEDEWAN